jgi:hypothetical protein
MDTLGLLTRDDVPESLTFLGSLSGEEKDPT